MVKYFGTVSTNIDLELKKKFKEKCQQQKTSMHEALRKFILDYVKEEQNNEQREGKSNTRADETPEPASPEDSRRDSEFEEVFG